MSIYSGFATRHQQQTYDQLLETVLYVFQRRLLKFYRCQEADQQKFLYVISKLHSQMKSMEGHKYLQPKSSNTFQQLINFLKNRQNKQNKNKIEGVLQPQLLITEPHDRRNSNNQNQVNILPVTVPKKGEGQVSKASHELSKKYTQRNSLVRQFYQYQQKFTSHARPTTTENQARIKKRISQKSFNQSQNNSRIDGLSFIDNQSNGVSNIKIQEKEDQNSGQKSLKYIQKTFQLSKQPLQHILNPSASRFAAISRKQARSQANKSYQSINSKRSTLKNKQKQRQKEVYENIEQNIEGKMKEEESDMRDLIKGYINKTKKNYIRAYKKRKNQIDQMLKFI